MVRRLTYDFNFTKSSKAIIFSFHRYIQKGRTVSTVQIAGRLTQNLSNFEAINSIHFNFNEHSLI